MNTTKMIPAAFQAGDVVEYLGERQIFASDAKTPLLKRGMRFTIKEVRKPEKGYGFIRKDEDGDEIISHDSDGYNVYQWADGFNCILWPADKDEWKLTTV